MAATVELWQVATDNDTKHDIHTNETNWSNLFKYFNHIPEGNRYNNIKKQFRRTSPHDTLKKKIFLENVKN